MMAGKPVRVMACFDGLVTVPDDKLYRVESVIGSCPIRILPRLPKSNRFWHVHIGPRKRGLQMEFPNAVRA